jgi:tRNA pseudouridine38-40 synthase
VVRNLKLTLEYDGTEFHGFQRQRGMRTVQGELERCFSRLLGEPIKVIGAGRTDAGAHATGQVANFGTSRPIPAGRLREVLNAALPADVKVQRCQQAPPGFHARRDARSRTYRYRVIERPAPSPMLGRYALVVPGRLEVGLMRRGAERLLGRRDFRAFQGGGAEAKGTERTLMRLACRRAGPVITVTAEADSFLYQMVRIMVGALLAVARREIEPEAVVAALAARERRLLPGPAPACGLCLVKVSY